MDRSGAHATDGEQFWNETDVHVPEINLCLTADRLHAHDVQSFRLVWIEEDSLAADGEWFWNETDTYQIADGLVRW